mgnify:FL=1|jgi:hypothetical protein
MDNARMIRNILNNTTGNIVDVYITLYKECILEQSDAYRALQFIIECADKYEFQDDEAPVLTSKEKINQTGHYYYRLVYDLIIAFAKENPSPEVFYKKIYSYVFDSDIFPKDEETQGILLYILGERIGVLPYYQAKNLIEMSNQEYKESIERIEPMIRKAIYMLNRDFSSRTEEASQIFEIMSNLESKEDKIVFLAVIIDLLKKHGKKKKNNQ